MCIQTGKSYIETGIFTYRMNFKYLVPKLPCVPLSPPKAPQTNSQTSEIKITTLHSHCPTMPPLEIQPFVHMVCIHSPVGVGKILPFLYQRHFFYLFLLKRRMSKTNAFYDCAFFPLFCFGFVLRML